ncbi:DUF1700 domain-containing protein [Staphylococcus sp. Marseille-Q5304]|uniref:HAAS signaling domain-containing protein n=1 Tax=Staphylococcus sp. Marseille-Q5304 TaxID=2942200 RepID=UPI002074832C|nr:DUF1700 domain-containing protein [Staphylococcus sp. Marseille-Q5304]
MNKNEYIEVLNRRIKKISREEKKDILNKYESHFISGYKDKKNDDEMIRDIGVPIKISNEINVMTALHDVEKEKNIKDIFNVIFSIMGLSFFNFIFIGFSLFAILLFLPFILAYFIAISVMICSPVILFVMGIINGFDTISINEVFEMIKGVFLGLILTLVGYYFMKNFFKFLTFYLKWNLNIFKREGI